ncbi:MAG TPA: hypothetical protein VIJ65_03940 [Acidobacteriaceae bacterium]
MLRLALPVLLLFPVAVAAQQVMSAHTLVEAIEQHGSSGTSIEPASTPVPMLMTMRGSGSGGWQFMLHANAFAANTQQQADSPRDVSERGRDAFFSTNWIMPMAQRQLGDHGRFGQLTLRAMLSLEPATISHRNYPLLFQQGETAYGAPIVDGQHPHDFFMEVAALYDLKLSPNTLLSFYAAPVGDPSIGPTAFPHRQSASEDPIAALGHHQEDSTHIAFNVLTGGLTFRTVRLELSGFHGAEPTEAHWHFEPSPNGHAIDSVATRLTVSPSADWTGQYSLAHIHSTEALYPKEDQQRQTASVMYHHTFRSKPMPAMPGMKMNDMSKMPGMKTNDMSKMPGMDMSGSAAKPMPPQPTAQAQSSGQQPAAMPMMHMAPEPTTDLATTLVWGRTRSLTDDSKENSYLAEALLRFASTNYLWTRLEDAGRSNELLLTPGTPLPEDFIEQPIGHVAAFTFGYDHDLPLGPHILAAPGAQFTVYRAPSALRTVYGATPTAEQIFIRFRLR